jgi:hypothetical protein
MAKVELKRPLSAVVKPSSDQQRPMGRAVPSARK